MHNPSKIQQTFKSTLSQKKYPLEALQRKFNKALYFVFLVNNVFQATDWAYCMI